MRNRANYLFRRALQHIRQPDQRLAFAKADRSVHAGERIEENIECGHGRARAQYAILGCKNVAQIKWVCGAFQFRLQHGEKCW